MGRPNELEKRLYLIGMLLTIVVSEKSAGSRIFFPQGLFKSFLYQTYHQPVRQTGNAIRAGPDRLTGTARGHDQAFHSPRKIERQFQGDASAHRVTDEVSFLNAEMIQ